MIAQQEIRQLPFEEKLLLLEAVWHELSAEPEKIDVPQWHKDILDAREREFLAGRDQALDWEEAKRQIRQAIQ